jgi:putative redox protein
MREKVTNCRAEITSDRAESHPKVYTNIHIHFIIEGKNLNDKKVSKAITLSSEKYCSASIMIGKTANITHDFELINT